MTRSRRRGAIVLLAGLALAMPSAAAAFPAPHIDARAWALIDARDGEVLASHALNRRLPIASTTKLMTAYLALAELRPGQIVRARPYSAIYGESLLGLRPGQKISVRDLLYGLILRSGNDAAYDLAVAAAGTEARFVRQMNRRAAALGLSGTHYANPIGLDAPGNYSTAADLTTLARRLMDIQTFAKVADTVRATLRSLRPPRRIVTRNELLLREPWVNGIKTGHTFGAGYVLVGAGRRAGVQLISALIGAPSQTERDSGTLRLLDYGFSLYHGRIAVRRGRALASPAIRYSGGELPLRASRSVRIGLRRGQRLAVSVQAPDEVEGPIHRQAELGRAIVEVDGERVASVPLRAARSIPEANALDRARSLLAGNALWLVLALSAILGGAVLFRRLFR